MVDVQKKRNRKYRLSLRAKFALVMSLIIILVSLIIVFVTVDLIFKDKEAYIYDSVYSSIENGGEIIERFFETKRSYTALVNLNKENIVQVLSTQAADPDLLRVFHLDFSDELGVKATNIFENTNKMDQYRDNLELIASPPKRELISLYTDVEKKGSVERILFEKGQAPHFFFAYYDKEKARVLVFDFLIDKLMQSIFSNGAFQFALVGSSGDVLYHNRLDDDDLKFQQFYEGRLEGIRQNSKITKVEEVEFGSDEYILGHRGLSNGYFVFGGVGVAKAFQVTKLLAYRMMVFALGLVVIFNILSLFLAKSVTSPLKTLIEGIKTISSGNFKYKVEVSTNDEISDLAHAFNGMGQKIQDYNIRLLEYNRTLELKVEGRTKELNEVNHFIKAVINSLSQGLLVFDKSGFCLDLYTKTCATMLGEVPKGKHLGNLIKAPNKEILNDWIENLFLEMIPFESLVELGVKAVPTDLTYDDSEFKHIALEYFPMRDQDKQIVNVVMVANDKTKEFVAEIELESERSHVKFVTKVMADKSNFISFKEVLLNDIDREILNIQKQETENFSKNDLMRTLHSLKGGTALYNLNHVAAKIHTLETMVLESVDIGDHIIEKMKEIKKHFLIAVEKLESVVNLSAKDNPEEVSEEQMSDLIALCREYSEELPGKVENIFTKKNAKAFIIPYVEMASKLALKLGKEIKPIEVKNGDIKIDGKAYRGFFNSCVHLFNNSIDHGIETPAIREQRGKDKAGEIQLSFEQVLKDGEAKLIFTMKDDGGGIPVSKIRKKMEKLGYSQEDVYKDEKDVLLHIFDSALSSNDEVTTLSGRGVGLYDIKKTVEEMGGEIMVESFVNQGTTFTFTLPYI